MSQMTLIRVFCCQGVVIPNPNFQGCRVHLLCSQTESSDLFEWSGRLTWILPNLNPLRFGFKHFIARLHVKGIVERSEVHQRPIHAPLGR